MRGLRFAVSVPNFGEFADVDAVVGLAREAEAAGWDGVVPIKPTATGIETLTPDEVREIAGYVRARRQDDAPFDVIVGGPPPWAGGFDLPAALPAYAEAGVTWWLESCGWEPGSFADLRGRVLAGPTGVSA